VFVKQSPKKPRNYKKGEQKEKLLKNIDFFKTMSSQLGLNFENSDSAIQPLIVGSSQRH